MSRNSRAALRRLARRYRLLCRRLARSGYLLKGSLQIRRTLCGHPSCRCHRAARFRHGPYYWWTSKLRGRTVTRLLSREEGKLYVAWLRNRRCLEQTVQRMVELSADVARVKLGHPPPWNRLS